MKNIIDDFDKGIGLDRNEIVAYRSSQRVVFSKEAGIGRNLAQARNCAKSLFEHISGNQKVRFLLRQLLK